MVTRYRPVLAASILMALSLPARADRPAWRAVESFIRDGWDNDISKADGLPAPLVAFSPGARFLFYWDTYFTNLGLLRHQRPVLARFNTENLLFVVEQRGFVGNASLTDWGMTRSQPPYLSMMVRASYEQPPLVGRDAESNHRFLRRAYSALQKEYAFWTDTAQGPRIEAHTSAIPGLQRFAEHFTDDEALHFYDNELVRRLGLPAQVSRAEKIAVGRQLGCEAATGMDFTPRFGHRCLDHVPVELNTNLWVYEMNFAWMATELGEPGSADWLAKADARRALIETHLWDDARGVYADYDAAKKAPAPVITALTFAPLWAGLASPQHAARVVANLALFERDHGVVTIARGGPATSPGGRAYQWGTETLWPPLHEIVVRGLDRYGARAAARRVATKWLDVVARNFAQPEPATYETVERTAVTRPRGRTFEKYDDRDGGRINDDEYHGNVQRGWTAGVTASLYAYVTAAWRPGAGLPSPKPAAQAP